MNKIEGFVHTVLKPNLFRKGSHIVMLDKIALSLLIIGGINWGLLGLFQFDLVAWIFGGQEAVLSRITYVLIAICALWCISLLFRDHDGT